MKYCPVQENIILKPITTPNKYISSYFGKNDAITTVKPTSTHQLVLNNNFIQFDKNIEQDFFINNTFNIKKYKNKQKCLNLFIEFLRTCKIEVSLQFIFCDSVCRGDLISFIDAIFNTCKIEYLMVLPMSLAISFFYKQNNCVFLYKDYFSIIDDYVMADTYLNYEREDKDAEIDFAEEYCKLKTLDENLKYSCLKCEANAEDEDKIKEHISKEHGTGDFFKYEKVDDLLKMIDLRMKFIFNAEKASKLKQNLYTVDCECEEGVVVDDYYNKAISGASVFFNLEVASELWLERVKWYDYRIRHLREKVIFYI